MLRILRILIVLQIVIMSLNAQTSYEFNKIPLTTNWVEDGFRIGYKLYFKTVYLESYPQLKPYYYLDSYDISNKKYKTGILDSYNNSYNLQFNKFYNYYDSLLIYRNQNLFILNHDNKKNYINFDYDSTKIASSHYISITEDENKNIYILKLDNKNVKNKDYDSTKSNRQMKIFKYNNDEFTLLYSDDDIREAYNITYFENKLYVLFKQDTTKSFNLLQYDLNTNEKVSKQYYYPTKNDFKNINIEEESNRLYFKDLFTYKGQLHTYFQVINDSVNFHTFFRIDINSFDIKYVEPLKSDISSSFLNITDYSIYNDDIICYTNSDQLNKNKILCTLKDDKFNYLSIENDNLKAKLYGSKATPFTFEENKIPIRYDFHIDENGTLCGFTSDGYVEIENVFGTTSVKTNKININVFPNPASESVTISGIMQGKVEIYNTLGQKLFEKEIFGTSTINTNELQTGMYLIKIESENEVTFENLIINK